MLEIEKAMFFCSISKDVEVRENKAAQETTSSIRKICQESLVLMTGQPRIYNIFINGKN